jgi:hypothetical protein
MFIGKVVSCGAILLYCLNLPLSIRFLTENTFVVGMTPAPHTPTVWTISHILDSVQSMIMEFDLPGKILPTYRYPLNGVAVAARIIPLLADLQAIRKVAGYVSHSARLFCSFCKCPKDNIEDLVYQRWEMRQGREVRAQAEKWRDLVTVTEKESWTRETGVRWTPLHNMPYWDPVKHVLLGFMHNFLEGVLQHQLRVLWGIGRTKAALKEIAELEDDDTVPNLDTSDVSDNSDWQGSQHGSASGLTDELVDMVVDQDTDMDIDDTDIDDPSETPPPPPESITLSLDDESDDEDTTPTPDNIFNFTTEELEMIRSCIRDVQLPTWVQRPPANLGELSHGKLKAHELLVLFSVIFPLIIPKLWWGGDEREKQLLQSFCDLVSSTNIIAAYSVTNAEADEYTERYIKYRASIQRLYGFHSRPNHHYAMHNGDLLKFWGPLSLLSEFPGERMNGDMGKIKTNRRLCESFCSFFPEYWNDHF